LEDEQAATLGLVDLADPGGTIRKAPNSPQEPAVGLVAPAHKPAAAPPVGTQRVEAAVVPNPVVRVLLDIIATEVAEFGPGVEVAGPAGHHCRHCIATEGGGLGQRISERQRCIWFGCRQHRLGRAGDGEVHGLIAHDPRVRRRSTNVTKVFALNVEAAKHLGLAISAGSVLLALFVAVFVRKAIAKALVILLLGGLIVVTMSQRSNISKCASRIQTDYRSGAGTTTTCKFFGRQFAVDVPSSVPDEANDGSVTEEPAE